MEREQKEQVSKNKRELLVERKETDSDRKEQGEGTEQLNEIMDRKRVEQKWQQQKREQQLPPHLVEDEPPQQQEQQ